jgi:spire-like protein
MARAGGCSDAAAPERAGGAARAEPWELSLEEVLKVYEQPINEEQAWAVCFQGCRGLRGAPGGGRRIRDTADILLRRDGSVGARREPGEAAGGGVASGTRKAAGATSDPGVTR